MAKTLWDINFSTLDTTATDYNGWGSKVTNYKNMATGVYNPSGTKLAVNAVDIDWNGATLDSTVISTTGDLLKYIKAKSNLTLGTTSTTAAAGNHTHSNYLTKVLKLEKTGTSTIDLLANTTYTLTVGDQTLAFKTPTDQTGGGGTTVTVTVGSNILNWNQNVTLATVDGVAIDAKLPTNPVTDTAVGNLGYIKKVQVGTTTYTPSSGVVSLPAYPTVPTYTAGTNITINSNTISHATPTAKTNIKGNKTTQLLATITTDSQGHVTDYDVITPSELWNLLKSYADALYEPKSATLTSIAWKTISGSSNAGIQVTTSTVTNKIVATYSDGTTREVDETSITVYTTSACTTQASSTWYNTANTYYIKGSYGGKTTTNAIAWTINSVTPTKSLTSITVTNAGPVDGTIYSGGTNKKSTTWTKGTVKANWSDNTSTDITSSVTPSLSTTTTGVITVNGTTITAVAAGLGTIKATYSYTNNGITKSVEISDNITVVARAIESIEWASTAEVTTTQGTLANLGNIKVTYNNSDTTNVAYTASGVALYTNSACTTTYTASAAAGNYAIYAKYSNKVTSSPKSVKVTSSTNYYYSVGTTEVTSSNYTTVNSAQYVTNVNNIPSSLNISTLTGPVYILLPSSKTPTIVPNSGAGTVALTSLTSPVSGYSYWKSARFAAGATMTIS